MELVLLRHGESEWNRLGLFTGWADVGLTQTGVEEAVQAGVLLRQEGYDFDICYTSYLKRAIRTLGIVLQEMDREWLPVEKSWKLNERHYGALQGLNKAETAAKYGEEQVHVWRRSFAVPPPALAPDDERNPRLHAQYRDVPPAELPLAESLATTIQRVLPYFEGVIKPCMLAGRRVLVAAHGNSLRALVKVFDGLSDEEIAEVNIPTGVPLVYSFDEGFRRLGSRYLGDAAQVQAKIQGVANQGKAK